MVVHVVAEEPKNGRPQAAPLIAICGKQVEVNGFYLRVGERLSERVCPACRAALAKGGDDRPREETEPGSDVGEILGSGRT